MDDVIINKAANLEQCIKRVREEYIGFENEFEKNYTKQDAIILNLLRACETAIDMGNHMVRLKSLGIPQSSRDMFVLLENANIISPNVSRPLQAMVGFRNIAVHNYTKLELSVVRFIIENHLDNLQEFSKTLVTLAL